MYNYIYIITESLKPSCFYFLPGLLESSLDLMFISTDMSCLSCFKQHNTAALRSAFLLEISATGLESPLPAAFLERYS